MEAVLPGRVERCIGLGAPSAKFPTGPLGAIFRDRWVTDPPFNQTVKYLDLISVNHMVNRAAVALDLDAVFAALAHPIRRAILERLAGGDASVTELAEPHDVSLPAISKHLRVLEDAGLLQVEPEGRVRRCQIDAGPLSAAFGWLTRYRVL